MGFTRFIIAISTFLIFISCSNSESENPPVDIPQDYTQFGIPFTNMPSHEDIVMYEVNIRAFSPEGNLQGVINKLNHIKSLGTNVIWLMPIHPVGQVNSINSPYCIKDYKSVGSEYGTLEDVRNLTTQAHQMGMAVILDWVANHTAWDHPWISSNPEWYTQNASGQIVHPPGTNWTDVADLNFNNQQMRSAMIDAMRYWVLEANVDGFRCDYADGVPFAFWNQAINHFKSTLPNRKVLWFAEGNRNDHFFAGFDLNFGWNFYGSLVSVWNGGAATQLYNTHIADYSNAVGNKQVLRFTTNQLGMSHPW
ncbi:MAG: alpha-amylase family glycosyl hydrolase [Flavobacterium sp.]